MSDSILNLPNKSIFLEFYIIEHLLYKKHEPFPKNFFTKDHILKTIKTEFRPTELCFVNNSLFLSENTSQETIDRLVDSRTNIIASINTTNKNRIDCKIIRNVSSVESRNSGLACSNFKSISPYGFSVNQINDNASIDFGFPNHHLENMQKDETFCFYCKRMPRGDGEWFTPGVLLIMFVKNHGLIDKIEFASKDHIERVIDIKNLYSKRNKIRDFRKSSLLFELG